MRSTYVGVSLKRIPFELIAQLTFGNTVMDSSNQRDRERKRATEKQEREKREREEREREKREREKREKNQPQKPRSNQPKERPFK